MVKELPKTTQDQTKGANREMKNYSPKLLR